MYVGRCPEDGLHYVVENAGGRGRTVGPWLQLTDVKSAFADLKGDESRFFVLTPSKAGVTAQRAMAAYKLQFRYKVRLWNLVNPYNTRYYVLHVLGPQQYSGFGFNCEAFTSACAGLWEDLEAESTGPKPNPLMRAILKRVNYSKLDQGAKERAEE